MDPYESNRIRLKLTFSERNPRHIEAYRTIVSQSESQKKYSEFIVDAVLAFKALGFRMPGGGTVPTASGEMAQLPAMSVADLEDMVRKIVTEQVGMDEESSERLRLYEQFEMGIEHEEEHRVIRLSTLSAEDEEELYDSLKEFIV